MRTQLARRVVGVLCALAVSAVMAVGVAGSASAAPLTSAGICDVCHP